MFSKFSFQSQGVWRPGRSGEEMGAVLWAAAYLAPVSAGRKFGPFIWWASSKTHRGQTDAPEAYLTHS